jgi:hypothetical protein
MILSKGLKSNLLIVLVFLLGPIGHGQIVAGNAYLMGDVLNVAIDGTRGKEGTGAGAGFHARGGGGATACGIVADPEATGWDPGLFDGDFFTPGTPENGWGIEIAGVNYSNNYNVGGVIKDPLRPVTHTVQGDCITVEWEGSAAGVIVNVKYHLVMTALFYTTEITLINTNAFDLTDVYYYRNIDPDNNVSISGEYYTTNTIESQPEDDCRKVLVSATHPLPHPSYMGFGAVGNAFRVSHGGFSNRDGSDIWNGTGELTGVLGAAAVADNAISLAHKSNIAAGDSVNFTYAIILSSEAVEGAFSSLYYIDYDSAGGLGGGLISECNPTIDTAQSCQGNPVTLSMVSDFSDDYIWVWESDPLDPDMPVDGPIIVVSPSEPTFYTVTGTSIGCGEVEITKTILVELTEGPKIEILDPGPFCEEFDITTLVFEDIHDIENTVTFFFSEEPDSAKQTEPIFAGPLMSASHEVWLMIADTLGACFDAVRINVIDCLSLDKNSYEQITIYPNPTSNITTIDFGDALVGDNQLLVHNALGQQAFSKTNITDKQFVLNVNELSKGIYYISLLDSSTEIFVAKLIVQ